MSQACEMPQSNPPEAEIAELLRHAKTIAIVGLSDKPDRDSYQVAAYLQKAGYKVIPVNPAVPSVLGEPAVASLRDVPGPIDIVNIFRKPEAVPQIVEDAIAVGAGAIWMQLGIVHNAAAEAARQANLAVIMNKCTKIEHARLL